MKLPALRALVAAVELGSLRNAARRLGISQPALTKSIQELERAAKLGRSLGSDKAMAVEQGVRAFLYSVAMTGNTPGATTSEKGWTGLVNNASAPSAQVAADGTGSSRAWSAKTPDQIVRDFYSAVNAVESGTGETHVATKVLLPFFSSRRSAALALMRVTV